MMPKRRTKKTRLINSRKIVLIVSFLIILFTIMSYTIGKSLAWFATGLDPGNIDGEAGQIDTYLNFEIDETIKGIPGATQPITTANKMKLGDKTDGYIYRIQYIVEGSTIDNVENLGLSKDVITNLGIIEDTLVNTNDKITRTYFGKQLIDEQDLGNLFLKFKEVSEFNINNDIKISVKLKVSQIHRAAFQDAYEIPDSQMPMFDSLFT